MQSKGLSTWEVKGSRICDYKMRVIRAFRIEISPFQTVSVWEVTARPRSHGDVAKCHSPVTNLVGVN